MTAPIAIPARIPWLPRLAYSLGNVAETILSRVFELFVLFYYTQVLGLSGSVAGLGILLAMVADAVSDPLIGSYSDSLRSRWGRRHTLMLASAVPSGLFFVALFAPPASLQGLALGGWLAIMAIGLRVSVAFFHIPWSTQIAELSEDPKERVTLAVLRNIFGAAASFAVLAIAFDVFFAPTEAFPRGQENPAAYLPFAVAIGGALTLLILLSAAGTYRRLRDIESQQRLDPLRFSFADLWPAWRDLVFRFRSFRSLFLGSLFLLTAFSLFNAFALYLGTYFWELSGDQIKKWQFALIIGAAVTFVLGKPIVDRVPPPMLFRGGIIVGVLLFALPILLRLVGVLPADPDLALLVLQITNGVAGFALGLVMIVSAVMASETADDFELRTGRKAAAMLFGFIFLAMKTASGLGKLLAGITIDVTNLPSAQDAHLITTSQLDTLGWSCVTTLVILGALGVIAFSGYRSPPRRVAAPVGSGLAGKEANTETAA